MPGATTRPADAMASCCDSSRCMKIFLRTALSPPCWPAISTRRIVAPSRFTSKLKVRSRESIRLHQAVNLLVSLRVLQGKFAEARQIAEQTVASRQRAAKSGEWEAFYDPQLAADANNAAVLQVLDPRAGSSPAIAPTLVV